MDEKPAPDWPRRVYLAIELADIRGPKANVDRDRRGYDRIAGLGKKLGGKNQSEASMHRLLRKTDWEPYELEAWLNRVADATELPYQLFTVPDLRAVLREALTPREGVGRRRRDLPAKPPLLQEHPPKSQDEGGDPNE